MPFVISNGNFATLRFLFPQKYFVFLREPYYVTLSFIYRYTMAVSVFRLFQRLSLYELTGFFFFIQFFIQLFLLPFGLPRRKLSLSFFGCKVVCIAGNNALARESISKSCIPVVFFLLDINYPIVFPPSRFIQLLHIKVFVSSVNTGEIALPCLFVCYQALLRVFLFAAHLLHPISTTLPVDVEQYVQLTLRSILYFLHRVP